MNPDPKLGWIYGKDEPVPCCKVCDSSHYPNLDYSEVLDTRTSQAFIQITSETKEYIKRPRKRPRKICNVNIKVKNRPYYERKFEKNTKAKKKSDEKES